MRSSSSTISTRGWAMVFTTLHPSTSRGMARAKLMAVNRLAGAAAEETRRLVHRGKRVLAVNLEASEQQLAGFIAGCGELLPDVCFTSGDRGQAAARPLARQ